MIFGIPFPADGKFHQYCLGCRREEIERADEDGRAFFCCRSCGRREERRIVVDPTMRSWVDGAGVYWHESAGVFVRNPDGEFLFFQRRIFPVSAFTVPAGHVEVGETPLQAAIRELYEESGLQVSQLEHIASYDIAGDSCRRGSDHHRWHAYRLVLPSPVDITAGGDDDEPAEWLTLEKARIKDLTYPVRYIIDRHAADLEKD